MAARSNSTSTASRGRGSGEPGTDAVGRRGHARSRAPREGVQGRGDVRRMRLMDPRRRAYQHPACRPIRGLLHRLLEQPAVPKVRPRHHRARPRHLQRVGWRRLAVFLRSRDGRGGHSVSPRWCACPLRFGLHVRGCPSDFDYVPLSSSPPPHPAAALISAHDALAKASVLVARSTKLVSLKIPELGEEAQALLWRIAELEADWVKHMAKINPERLK